MKIWVSALWVVMLSTSLFALDYEVKSVKVLPVESYPARVTLGGVTIAADPYSTNEKSFSAFDVKDLNSNGYFPLHVIIRNESSSYLRIQILSVILIASSGQQLYTTPATVVVDDVVKSGLTSRIPLMKSHDPATSKKAGSPLSDFTAKELTNRIIEPGTITDGFLFFFTPDPKKNLFVGGTLYIPKLEEEGTGKTLGPFFIPLDPAFSYSK
jgi:hypothetical protein